MSCPGAAAASRMLWWQRSRMKKLLLWLVVETNPFENMISPGRGGGFQTKKMKNSHPVLLLELSIRPKVTLHQGGGIHFLVQLDLEPLWNATNQLHLVFGVSKAKGAFLPQGLLDLHVKIHGQISLNEELQKLGLFLCLLRACRT